MQDLEGLVWLNSLMQRCFKELGRRHGEVSEALQQNAVG